MSYYAHGRAPLGDEYAELRHEAGDEVDSEPDKSTLQAEVIEISSQSIEV